LPAPSRGSRVKSAQRFFLSVVSTVVASRSHLPSGSVRMSTLDCTIISAIPGCSGATSFVSNFGAPPFLAVPRRVITESAATQVQLAGVSGTWPQDVVPLCLTRTPALDRFTSTCAAEFPGPASPGSFSATVRASYRGPWTRLGVLHRVSLSDRSYLFSLFAGQLVTVSSGWPTQAGFACVGAKRNVTSSRKPHQPCTDADTKRLTRARKE
jgi:hypothetical protein